MDTLYSRQQLVEETDSRNNVNPFTKEQVEQANMLEAVELCQRHQIPFSHAVTVQDIRRELLQYLNEIEGHNHEAEEEIDENIQNMIQEITGKDIEMKTKLSEIYDFLMMLIGMPQFDQMLKKEFKTKYGDYISQIKKNQAELEKKDCPIVVTGETSAGKSSLLNLFLGCEILPSSLLRCTSVICRLRNSAERKVVVYDQNETPTQVIEVKDVEELKQTIKKYTCFNEDVDPNKYKYVDIHWSIPMLHDHVIIVDTPGIGETEELTDIVLEYLQDAVSFIYVINSANAGGVQSDRILRIIKQQHKWKREGKLQMFDHRLAVFVCNKWDQVPSDEDTIVWKDTINKLSQSWIGLSETQVMKLSVHEETRRKGAGLYYSEKFIRLLNFIKTMVPLSLEGKVKRHVLWLLDFLRLVQHSTATKINASRKTKEEKHRFYERLESRLDHLTTKTKEIKQKLDALLDEKSSTIVKDLVQFLQNPDTRHKLSRWTMDECPSVNSIGARLKPKLTSNLMEITKSNALSKIRERLQNEIGAWFRQNETVVRLPEEFKHEFKKQCRMLQDETISIHGEMVGFQVSERLQIDIGFAEMAERKLKKLEGANEMIALGTGVGVGLMTAIFGVVFPPILIGTLFIGLCVMIGYNNRFHRQVQLCKEDYNEKRQDYMKEWTVELLDALNEKDLRRCLEEWYFRDVRDEIRSVFDYLVPKIVETDRIIMKDVISDQRRVESISRHCQPLQLKAEECQGRVLLFELQYLSDKYIKQDRIRLGDLIGQGVSARVFNGEICQNRKWIPVAIKVFKFPLSDDISYLQLQEIENLFNFNHPNILHIYGASLVDVADERNLQIITELCDSTLSDIQDNLCCGILQKGSYKFKEALKFYLNVSIQISEGVEHIHSKCCVHRDLKLQNILMKGDVIKIADTGQLKSQQLVTGSIVGTPTHMAPEVLRRQYSSTTTAMDIYSFGIILWEMWYKKQAFSETQYPNIDSLSDMRDLLARGERPSLQEDIDSFPLLKELIESCWYSDPLQRPSATQVKDKLRQIQSSYIS